MPQQEFLMPQPSTSAGSVVYYDLEFAKKLVPFGGISAWRTLHIFAISPKTVWYFYVF
jgi:hypothetical protein